MELRIKLTAKEIFIFSIIHFYKTMAGVFSVICAAMVLGVVVVSWSSQTGVLRLVLFLSGVVVVVCQPFMLYQKAVKQTQNTETGKEIFYKMDYNGVKVQQGKEKAVVYWNQILKIKKLPGIYVMYLNRSRAYLFPERSLVGGKKEQFLKVLIQHVPAEKRKGI